MWGSLLRIATIAFAGAGFTDFFSNIFSGSKPVEAVQRINWVRLALGALGIVLAYILAKQVFKQKFD